MYKGWAQMPNAHKLPLQLKQNKTVKESQNHSKNFQDDWSNWIWKIKGNSKVGRLKEYSSHVNEIVLVNSYIMELAKKSYYRCLEYRSMSSNKLLNRIINALPFLPGEVGW